MNKLALLASLRLQDEDSIQLLINGISSIAIKAAAATLNTDSLDGFLRNMQHITATCNDIKKCQPSGKINRRIRVVPALLKQNKKISHFAPIVVEETTPRKIASNLTGKSNQST